MSNISCYVTELCDYFSLKNKIIVSFFLCVYPTGNASFYFREIGGLMFVKNLAKSSQHSIVKEAALYTLGIVAEQNGK